MLVSIICVCFATWSFIWDIILKQSGVYRNECVCVQSKLKPEGNLAINIPLYTKEECLTHQRVSPVGFNDSLSLVLLFEYTPSYELCPLLGGWVASGHFLGLNLAFFKIGWKLF